ncbi:sn-glycerol-3-phosphate ABC transporter ATP-binding protein UgpC [Simiduia curdlanivorans]|uniref:ABC transporter ATP-binding protein n=1 Tax=Simiduia curdlanivorans TaxID=1492769 RepID=A0ABV8V4B1_9GAMM|nr:sn-glycerol-3-phosphate ABC transporter ATP-binding protein UgpC [Simiduia curdlanivorans]MDN3640144.1 sn-glycerol-3-phosphate ABC transporter ATP-binding protein UgpC [Simiduia curdlanivorans]
MNNTVIVKNLKIERDHTTVIKDLSLTVDNGEFVVLLGPSGCGKSTLLNAIAGLLNVSSGSISISDRDVTHAEPKDRGLAMVFQSYALYPTMTAYENLAFALKVAGAKKAEITARVKETANTLQIESLLDRKPHQLSGGQRQRVAIGRALVRQKGVLLFDEPLSNLDTKLRTELRLEIKRLHHKFNNTLIYVTHDQVEAMTLADRIAVMHAGDIEQIGSPMDIYHNPQTRFVAEFIGSPAMNFIQGHIELGDAKIEFVCETLRLDISNYQAKQPLTQGQAVCFGIRPEALTVGKKSGPYELDLIEQMGADCVVWCHGLNHHWVAKAHGDFTAEVGAALDIDFDCQQISLFDPVNGQRL